MLTPTRQITLMDEQEQICMEIVEGMSAMIDGLIAAVVLGAVAVEVEADQDSGWKIEMDALHDFLDYYYDNDPAHDRYARPRPRVRKVTVTNSFAERWSKNPDHYRDYYGAEEVEIK